MGSVAIHRHVTKDVFPKLYEQVCVVGETRILSMITQIIKGQGWYFSSRIRLISWKSSNADDDHDTFC